MFRTIKIALYFTVARYFRFFARIRLRRWDPRIVIITGSNGKTMALHLTQVQLREKAKYSFLANSAFGVSFDILGLKRTSFSLFEWVRLAVGAPLHAWRSPYAEEIYVVEADCDRPGEGDFLGSLLRPEVCVWLSSARTHSQLFEKHARTDDFKTIEETIAHEFGYFIEHTSKLAVLNTDNPLIANEMKRTSAHVIEMNEATLLEEYAVSTGGSTFRIEGATYRVPALLPKETFYAIAASVKIAEYFGIRPTTDLASLTIPPGRSSVLQGIRGTTIIDSSYNANVDSLGAVLRMVEKLAAPKKWLVLGDLTEQGMFEKEEHEKIPRLIARTDIECVILVGPRMRRYALPGLLALEREIAVESFIDPKEALDYLLSALKGNEMLVFKGARFLEGIIEHLLLNRDDAVKLCRREKVWQMRRQKWGL